MYVQLEPAEPKNCNSKVLGADKKYSLPAVRTGESVITKWNCKRLIARVVFLFTGNLNIVILSTRVPSFFVTIGQPVRAKNE